MLNCLRHFLEAGRCQALAASRPYSVGEIQMLICPSRSITKSSYESWSNLKTRATRLQYIGPSGPLYTYSYHRTALGDAGGSRHESRIDGSLNQDA